ncbi:hypothetical protein ZIOFF_015505 [Zingiber officinale]|uniref:Uncharacterized protein n=1 Tax=Zingiber officinale TaxID=94328 RepID=A0A8J5I0F1_ZINOF|nr:hypothetical protein ZIOFF_015505 [Zingiber officinale]
MVVVVPAIPSYRRHCASTIESLFLCRHLSSGHEERSLHPIADETPPLPPSSCLASLGIISDPLIIGSPSLRYQLWLPSQSPSASVAAFAVQSSKTTPLRRRCRSKVQVRESAQLLKKGLVRSLLLLHLPDNSKFSFDSQIGIVADGYGNMLVHLNVVATFIGIVGLTIAAGVLVVLLVWYPSESTLSHEPPVSFTASVGFSVANIHNGFEPV